MLSVMCQFNTVFHFLAIKQTLVERNENTKVARNYGFGKYSLYFVGCALSRLM